MIEPVEQQRRQIHYHGRVQGVGFRYTAQAIATRYQVTGYVKNLSDGRVLLVAEGEPNELDRFVGALDREMADYIAGRQVDVREASGEFKHFDVRY